MTDRELTTPETYGDWLKCFEILASGSVSQHFLDMIECGICPEYEHLEERFLERLQYTVKEMLTRSVKRCNKNLNELLEDGDFSSMEVFLRRSYTEMDRCRFYRKITFLKGEFLNELDLQVVAEKTRYWSELKQYLTDIAEESGNSELYDTVYYMKRLG